MIDFLVVCVCIYVFFKVIGWTVNLIPHSKSKEQLAKEIRVSERNRKRTQLQLKLPKTLPDNYPQLLVAEDDKFPYKRRLNRSKGHNIKQGKSESIFYKYLEKYFGDVSISWNSKSIEGFIPDFALESADLKLVIEIDEPYTYPEKIPIHYKYVDLTREIVILDRGWSMLRFSEKQISIQPWSCCKVVAQTIDYLIIQTKYAFLFSNVEPVSYDPLWSMEQAAEMAKKGYRLNYASDSVEKVLNPNIDGGEFETLPNLESRPSSVRIQIDFSEASKNMIWDENQGCFVFKKP